MQQVHQQVGAILDDLLTKVNDKGVRRYNYVTQISNH